MRTFPFVVPFVALLAGSAVAENLTWDALLKSIDNEPSVQAANKKNVSIENGSSTKLWNSLEFQYKLDGFGFMSHDFEIRFKPNVWGETSASREYWKAQQEYQKTRSDQNRSYLVYDRYERGLRYLLQLKKNKIHEEMAAVNRDRVEVLHLKSGAETFRPDDLIAALEREADLRAELISDTNSIQDAEMKFRTWVDYNEIALDTNFFPTIEEIESFLKENVDVDDSYPALVAAKQKQAVAEKRYDQENVGANKILSSIGLGYKYQRGSYEYDSVKTGNYVPVYLTDGSGKVTYVAEKDWQITRKPDDRRTRDKFYATVTLRLPFFGSDGGDETKRQLDVLDAESDYLDEKRSLSQKVARIREEILALIAQRKVQKEFTERVDAGGLFEEFATRSGSDPLLLLRAKEVSLESQLHSVKLEYEIYTRYLVLLDYAGAFMQQDPALHLKGK